MHPSQTWGWGFKTEPKRGRRWIPKRTQSQALSPTRHCAPTMVALRPLPGLGCDPALGYRPRTRRSTTCERSADMASDDGACSREHVAALAVVSAVHRGPGRGRASPPAVRPRGAGVAVLARLGSYREQCQELAWLQELRSLASCSCIILSSSPSEYIGVRPYSPSKCEPRRLASCSCSILSSCPSE